jgi:type II secretory pathway component PulJ
VHEYAPLAITLVAIFAGILVNKYDLNSLKADMNARFERTDKQFEEVNRRLLAIEADLRQFYSITGELKARVELLEKRR